MSKKIFVIISLIFSFLSSTADTDLVETNTVLTLTENKQMSESENKNRPVRVRVLLDEKTLDGAAWVIKAVALECGKFTSCSKGFKVYTSNKKTLISDENLNIKVVNNIININGSDFAADKILIKSECGLLEFNGVAYEGIFTISVVGTKAYLVNSIGLERYVSSVLYGESWPGWCLEINEVFAVMCRSYVSRKVMDSRTGNRKTLSVYDIRSDNYDQTYKGYHRFSTLDQAVQNTAGIVIAYGKEPILAMYDCCCGGIIPANIKGNIRFEKAPYLARKYACNYCKKCKLYSWSMAYNLKELQKLFSEYFPDIQAIKNIKILRKDPAGLVQEIEIITSNNNIKISGQKLYTILKQVKSLCFSIEKKGTKVFFKGNGYGHHIGLCQWGAKQMVKEGSNYKKVINFYYPNTHLMKVKANYA